MFGTLFWSECKQTCKSLIYWIFVVCLAFFFFSQMGKIEVPQKPEPNQAEYGTKKSKDETIIMECALQNLVQEGGAGEYRTYPIGFVKYVHLNEADQKRVEDIIQETTGMSVKELDKKSEEYYREQQEQQQVQGYVKPMAVEPAPGLDYGRFMKWMEEVDELLGGGSSYSKEPVLNSASEPMTYDDAMDEYNDLIEMDQISGGYARLFCDYMGIALGILTIFVVVTRGLRDKRARMQELIFSRKASAFQIVAGRYCSMVVMMILPVLLLTLFPLSECIFAANRIQTSVDYTAFVVYSFGWLLPIIMIVTALGMLLTELTDTAIAVLVQGIWWFLSIFAGSGNLSGGMYGWNLIPRHNSARHYTVFLENFGTLAANRILYASVAIVLAGITVIIYSRKRKGQMDIYGKIFANRKRKSKV